MVTDWLDTWTDRIVLKAQTHIRVCVECGNVLEGNKLKYCSSLCEDRERWRRRCRRNGLPEPRRTCATCSTPLLERRPGCPRIYCDECRPRKEHPTKPAQTACVECGGLIEQLRGSGRLRLCCVECREARKYKPAPRAAECAECGDPISLRYASTTLYCKPCRKRVFALRAKKKWEQLKADPVAYARHLEQQTQRRVTQAERIKADHVLHARLLEQFRLKRERNKLDPRWREQDRERHRLQSRRDRAILRAVRELGWLDLGALKMESDRI